MNNTLVLKSVKTKTIATIIAIVCSVTLPIIIHIIGRALHINTALGEILLPLHFFIILLGLLSGSITGAIAGFCSPIISSLLTGMPTVAMLPFITIETVSYGVFAGLVANKNFNTILKVLTVQVLGRLTRAIALVIAHYTSLTKIPMSIIYTSISKGLCGIILQLILIPLILYFVTKHNNDKC